MSQFNLEDYEPVEERLRRFYKDHPEGRVLTELVSNVDGTVMFKAFLYRDFGDDKPWSTGYAEETKGDGYVNKTSHVENCETSAIGRALANANYSGDKRPSREEMSKVQKSENMITKKPAVTFNTKPSEAHTCSVCDDPLDEAVYKYSMDRMGKPLCRTHQKG